MTIIDKLLSLQEIDCQIRDLEKELKDIPARQSEEESRLKAHTEALAKAEEALKHTMAELKVLELEGHTRQEKISKLRTQQLDLKTNKEFKAIETEIKAIADSITALEDQELGIMERIEAGKAGVKTSKTELEAERAAIQKDVKVFDDRKQSIEAELEGLRARRGEAAKLVDPKWRQEYERIFPKKGKGLVAIEEGVCGGCHMMLAPYVYHAAKKMDAIVICEFCGRMLYSKTA